MRGRRDAAKSTSQRIMPVRHIVNGEVIGAIGASFDMPEQDVQAESEMVLAGCWPCGYVRWFIAEELIGRRCGTQQAPEWKVATSGRCWRFDHPIRRTSNPLIDRNKKAPAASGSGLS
jgi:hypothetical protein